MTGKLEAGSRDHSLDGWRGLAIVGVMIDHFVTRAGINLGRLGVEMFFVLSGLLMAEILFVAETPLGQFVFRRLSRIYPALFVFSTIVALVSTATGALDISWQAYLSAVTLTANYVCLLWRRTYDFDHIWSLCVECHTYIALGLIAVLHRRTGWGVRTMLAGLAALAILNGAIGTWWLHLKYNAVYWRSDVRGASILLGALGLLLVRDPPEGWRWVRAPWTSPILTIAGLLLNINAVPDPIKYSAGTVCLALGVASLANAAPWFHGLFRARALAAVGLVSYSIYLWQEPFNEVDDPALRLKLLPLALLCGVASYFLVEGPSRRAINRLVAPRPDIAPQAVPAR